MRDGIYKGLPLGRSWKRLLRWCEREADRGTKTASAARHAIEADVRREVSATFIQEMKSVANAANSVLPGFFAADLSLHQSFCARERTPFEDILARSFVRNLRAGLTGSDLVQTAFTESVSGWKRRQFKLVHEHYRCEGGETGISDVIAALRAALDSADTRLIAERSVAGEVPSKPTTRPVDPDEDLR